MLAVIIVIDIMRDCCSCESKQGDLCMREHTPKTLCNGSFLLYSNNTISYQEGLLLAFLGSLDSHTITLCCFEGISELCNSLNTELSCLTEAVVCAYAHWDSVMLNKYTQQVQNINLLKGQEKKNLKIALKMLTITNTHWLLSQQNSPWNGVVGLLFSLLVSQYVSMYLTYGNTCRVHLSVCMRDLLVHVRLKSDLFTFWRDNLFFGGKKKVTLYRRDKLNYKLCIY